MSYTTIVSEGGLLPADILDRIAAGDAPGQRPEDFGMAKTARVSDAIAAAWGDARAYWESFKRSLARLDAADPATRITRERWIIPLLETLGFADVTYVARAAVVNGRTYAISHRADGDDDGLPIHIEGYRTSLDQRTASKPRLSPHSLLQEYLNDEEAHLWAIVTNGDRLRLLRDLAQMTRPRYVEFDLTTMLEAEQYAEFAILYRLLHRSRFPKPGDDASRCILEEYYQQAEAEGGRVRERLREGVETALLKLGNGLLEHPGSAPLRQALASGEISAGQYYRELLRLVYRLLFLMVAEERTLIEVDADEMDHLSPRAHRPDHAARLAVYRDHYSIGRLRRLAEGRGVGRGPYDDLWLGLLQTFRLFEAADDGDRALGLMPLDGGLFGSDTIEHLEDARLRNAALLGAIRALSLYQDRDSKITRRVNYSALDVEELGSVYESLLDYRPLVAPDGRGNGGLRFDLVSGTERKTTGSYYTRPELVHELVKSALEPVIEARLKALTPALSQRERGQEGEAKRKEAALLGMTVCDPACGSGHFLLAAARRLARELARVRSGENEPTPDAFRVAVRDVIAHCIYGVDLNPLAVDLCKLALWIEGYARGKPLNFLDHHIKLGNSLIGATEELVAAGIPDDAYKAVTGDDKGIAAEMRKRNKTERVGWEKDQAYQRALFGATAEAPDTLADDARRVDAMAEDSVGDVHAKQTAFQHLLAEGAPRRALYNLWTAAFFLPLTQANAAAIPTTRTLQEYRYGRPLDGRIMGKANGLAEELHFFHWALEFPQVFDRGGFDVILGNPPWERIKLQEEEHWVDVAEIAKAANKAERERRIEAWRKGTAAQQARVAKFDLAKHTAEAESRFVRVSGRFPLTAVGDVNTYALFAELDRGLVNAHGRAGIIVPTGIATDDTNKDFFGDLNQKRQLASLYDFENRDAIFPGVHRSYKFSLLTLGAAQGPTRFCFFATNTRGLEDEQRVFSLSPQDIALVNPNTRTVPVFRTRADAELTKKIYERVPVLVNERTGENPWGVSFMAMFHMSNDSHLFQTAPGDGLLPLYEAKLIHQFTHRWATYQGSDSRDMTVEELADPTCVVTPRYWVAAKEVEARLAGRWGRGWLLGFRDIARSTDERTALFSLLPRVGVGNKIPLLFFDAKLPALRIACFLGCVNSLSMDYVARQKVGGTTLNFFIVKQFPVLPPSAFSPADIAFISERVLELVYTAWDMRPFAADLWAEMDGAARARVWARVPHPPAAFGRSPSDNGESAGHAPGERPKPSPRTGEGEKRGVDEVPPPFRWDEERRAWLRAELDARIARLYGLTRDELRYILDPADVHGPDFPGETFRVLKKNELKAYGEYRTQRLVLAAWDGESP